MNLKPQDIVILLKILSLGDSSWTYSSLSSSPVYQPRWRSTCRSRQGRSCQVVHKEFCASQSSRHLKSSLSTASSTRFPRHTAAEPEALLQVMQHPRCLDLSLEGRTPCLSGPTQRGNTLVSHSHPFTEQFPRSLSSRQKTVRVVGTDRCNPKRPHTRKVTLPFSETRKDTSRSMAGRPLSNLAKQARYP